MPDSIENLRTMPMFEGLEDDVVEKFLSMADTVTFEKDNFIIVEMTEGEVDIYLILEGQVEVATKMMDDAYHVEPKVEGPGYPIGIQAFVLPGPRLATAKALTPLKALHWKAKDWEELFDENPRLGYQFCRTVARGLFRRLRTEYFRLMDDMEWGLGG